MSICNMPIYVKTEALSRRRHLVSDDSCELSTVTLRPGAKASSVLIYMGILQKEGIKVSTNKSAPAIFSDGII